MNRHVLQEMGFLPEGSGADLADEGLLAGVDLEVLLEVEALAVDEESAHRAALVAAPVVVHVLKEGQKCIYDVHCILGIF